VSQKVSKYLLYTLVPKYENNLLVLGGLVINYNSNGDGGIQGHHSREFFIDSFGVIANSFLKFSSNNLVTDTEVRPIKLDSKLIKYVYPNSINSY
jgi:hypothetical protein